MTGAAGFLGARLVRALLARGAAVEALVRPGGATRRLDGAPGALRLRAVDLLDLASVRRAVREASPEIVIHLAAPAGHPEQARAVRAFVAATERMTAHLLDALNPVPFRRLVHVGSYLEYGPKEDPQAETDPPAPATARGEAKARAADLVLRFARASRRSVVRLRPFSVYGPGEPESRLVPTLIRAARSGEAVSLVAHETRRDFVFVDDVVAACRLAAEGGGIDGEVFDVGTGVETPVSEVAALVEELTGRRLTRRSTPYPARPVDALRRRADLASSRTRLGWTPVHDLRSGLAKTIAALAPEEARPAWSNA